MEFILPFALAAADGGTAPPYGIAVMFMVFRWEWY